MKACIYARVSTSHHDQKPEVQVEELKRYCQARSWTVTREIVDHGYSGATDVRPGLKELLALARERKIDVIVVTKMDRLFRSLRHLITALEEFDAIGVKFVATLDHVDFSTASGRLMVGVLGSLAEFERSLIRERTILGLEHARRKGVKLGRPQIHNPEAIVALWQQGLSYREIGRRLKAPMGTITRAVKGAQKVPVSG
jgi:DNA invertase Pin-like site-specific DNA recombinase